MYMKTCSTKLIITHDIVNLKRVVQISLRSYWFLTAWLPIAIRSENPIYLGQRVLIFLALKKVFVWYIKDSKNWLLAVNSSSLMISNVLPLAQGCLQGAGLQNFQALQLLLIPSSPTRFSGSLYSDPTSSSVQQSASLCSHRWPGIPAQRFELEKSVCMHTRRAVRPCLRVCTQMDAHVHTDRQTLTQAHRCAVSKSMSRICFLLSLYASHEMKQESREE